MVTHKEAKLELELDRFLAVEEDYWKTRLRAEWLKEGDRNTTFFHQKYSSRYKCNSISMLKDLNDNEITDPTRIEGSILQYFQSIYSSINSNCVLQVDMIDPLEDKDILSLVKTLCY